MTEICDRFSLFFLKNSPESAPPRVLRSVDKLNKIDEMMPVRYQYFYCTAGTYVTRFYCTTTVYFMDVKITDVNKNVTNSQTDCMKQTYLILETKPSWDVSQDCKWRISWSERGRVVSSCINTIIAGVRAAPASVCWFWVRSTSQSSVQHQHSNSVKNLGGHKTQTWRGGRRRQQKQELITGQHAVSESTGTTRGCERRSADHCTLASVTFDPGGQSSESQRNDVCFLRCDGLIESRGRMSSARRIGMFPAPGTSWSARCSFHNHKFLICTI